MTRRSRVGAAAILLTMAVVAAVAVSRGAGGAGSLTDRTREAQAALAREEGGVTGPGAEGDPAMPTPTTMAAAGTLPFRRGDLVFVDRTPGPDDGWVSVWRDGERLPVGVACHRVHATAGRAVCEAPTGNQVDPERTEAVLLELAPGGVHPLGYLDVGHASSARVAPDGTLGAATVYGEVEDDDEEEAAEEEEAAGEEGEEEGEQEEAPLTATTTITRETSDGVRFLRLGEDFGRDGVAPNWRDVTFAPSGDSFFVAAGLGDDAEIWRGEVSDRRLDPYLAGFERPSLSPDGHVLVVTRPGGASDDGGQLVAIDLATGARTVLAGERRPVADQVEWFDDDTILYAVPRAGTGDGDETGAGRGRRRSDVWSLDLRPGARPERLLVDAESPSVVRADAVRPSR